MKTDSLEEFQNAKIYGKITCNRRGRYELHFPTKMNKELKALMGRDFVMNVSGDGETLQVILTDKQSKKRIGLNLAHASKTEN